MTASSAVPSRSQASAQTEATALVNHQMFSWMRGACVARLTGSLTDLIVWI